LPGIGEEKGEQPRKRKGNVILRLKKFPASGGKSGN